MVDKAANTAPQTTTVVGSEGKRSERSQAAVQRHDFRQPSVLASADLRKLRARHEEFVASLSSRLSMYLRMPVSMEIARQQTVSYRNFAESLANPTHLVLFKAEPLRGVCLLDIPPQLGLSLVDRLLGGSAQASPISRNLTEIETALLDQAVQIILTEWCHSWQGLKDLRPALLGHETNGGFLQSAPPDTIMLTLSVSVQVGHCAELIQMAFPHYTIEPLVKQLAAAKAVYRDTAPAPVAIPPSWNPALNDISVPLSAGFGAMQLTARELACLKPGDILLLDGLVAEQVQVNVASVPKFEGRLGTRGRNWAVEIMRPANA